MILSGKLIVALITTAAVASCVMQPMQPANTTPMTVHQLRIQVDQNYFDTLTEYSLTKPPSDLEIPCLVISLLGNEDKPLKASLSLHGGASRLFPKKSFCLKFDKEQHTGELLFNNSAANALDNTSFSEIVLNATAIDISYLRNYLTMVIARRLGGLAPRITFAELYVNDAYYGFYNVIESVNKDLIANYFKHPYIDLHKAVSQNANLKSVNYFYKMFDFVSERPNDSLVPPEFGFEIKNGNADILRGLEFWLESGKATYDSICHRTSAATLFSYFLTELYCCNLDGLNKNYYFADNKISNQFEFIPWDNDATFGRNWNGAPAQSIPLRDYATWNGLFQFLSNNTSWVNAFKQRYVMQLRPQLSPDRLLREIDEVQESIQSAAIRDMEKWWPSLSADFNCRGWNYWSTLSSHPKQRWNEELELLRSFIRERLVWLDGQILTCH